MHLVYIDDARDEAGGAFSALLIPENTWQECFDRFRSYRRSLRQSDGIYIHKEFHAWKFVSGRGRIADGVIPKGRRVEIFKATLKHVAGMPGLSIINALFPHKRDETAFEWLLNRINKTMEMDDSRALIVSDKGKERAYTRLARRMHVYNPIPSMLGGNWAGTDSYTKNIPIDRVIEDHFFKDSDRSYFIQLADFCAYALLRKERPTSYTLKYGLHEAFDLLEPVLVKKASGKDPWRMGIIRVPPPHKKAGPTPDA